MAVRTYRYHGNKHDDDRTERIELTDAHGVRRTISLNEDVDLTDDQYNALSQIFHLPRSTGQPVVPPPNLETVRAAVSAPVKDDVIIYDADKGVFVNNDLSGTLKDYLHAIGGRAKEPVKRVLARNDFTNPRAVARTNWGQPGSNSVFTPAFTDIDDADFVSGVEYGANGHCWRGTATMQAVGGTSISARFGNDGTKGTVVCLPGQIVFFRCLVKVVNCPPDCLVSLESVFDDAAGANRTYRALDQVPNVNPGDIFILEGFAPATQVRAHARVMIADWLNNGGPVEMRVGQAQIVVEPEGDVPDYVDGYRLGGKWDGAVDASTSWASVWPVQHDDDFKGGFNFFQLFHTDSPADAEKTADYCVELGLTNIRMSNGGGPMGCDGAWPAGQKEPNWDNDVLNVAKLAPALRKRGLKYTLLTGAPCTWMTTNGSNSLGKLDQANHLSDWIRLHTSLITYLGDVVDSVEFQNEVNLVQVDPDLWNKPDVYTQLCGHLYDAIKAMRPDITFVAGCPGRLVTTDPAYGTSTHDWIKGMFDEVAAEDREPPWDAISVHPYTDDLSTSPSPSGNSAFHSGFDQIMYQARTAMHDGGYPDTPLWVTEYGWPLGLGGNERSQMQYMSLLRGRMKRKGLKAAYFHTLLSTHDVPSGWQQTFSFLELDTERRRPVFEAFKRNGIAPSAAWRALTLLNSWVATGPPWSPIAGKSVLGVRKDDQGNCELKGIVSKTTGAATDPICTLPDGYIPSAGVVTAVTIYTGSAWQLGVLYIMGRQSGSPGNVYLNAGGSIAASALNILNVCWQVDS